jgi:hypothetical protein
MTHNNEEKWRTVERLMKLGTVLVHINSRNCLSVIPDHLVGRDQVVFQIGHDMPVPIRDLQLNERGFSGTLSFSGVGSSSGKMCTPSSLITESTPRFGLTAFLHVSLDHSEVKPSRSTMTRTSFR